jgi:hypothetical protein
MVELINENKEFRDSTYKYILAIQTQVSFYICFSINNELAHDVKVDLFKVPFSIRKGGLFYFDSRMIATLAVPQTIVSFYFLLVVLSNQNMHE